MSNSDHRLILVSDNSKKVQVRYRKTGDSHWNTLYLDETDMDKVIDSIIAKLSKKVK